MSICHFSSTVQSVPTFSGVWGGTTFQQTIDNPDQSSGSWANDVSIAKSTKDRIAIAFQEYDDGGNVNQGRVYIYRLSAGSYVEEQVLDPPNSESNLFFGQVVKLSDDGSRLFTSYSTNNPNLDNLLFYYTRTGTTWTLQQTYDAGFIGGFNNIYVIDASSNANTLVIKNSTTSGDVQLLSYNSGSDSYSASSSQPTLPSSPSSGKLGQSCALSEDGNILAISYAGNNEVLVYFFNGSSWSLRDTISVSASDADPKSLSVNIDGTFISYSVDPAGVFDDSFFVFSWNGSIYQSVGTIQDPTFSASGISSNGLIAAGIRSGLIAKTIESESGATFTSENTVTPVITPQSTFPRALEISRDGRRMICASVLYSLDAL